MLTVRDAAKLLLTAEGQIYRWIDDGDIPFQKVNEQIRFHRAELLEWATARRLPVSVEMFDEGDGDGDGDGHELPSFAAALALGGIHYDVEAADRKALIAAIVSRLPLPPDADRELILDVLGARETLGSTGIGDGIAIPHVRSPMISSARGPSVTLCFVRTPIEFAASDGKPVHALFTLLTPTINVHLQLLAKVSWALLDPAFRALVSRQAPAAEILAGAERVESTFPHAGQPGKG